MFEPLKFRGEICKNKYLSIDLGGVDNVFRMYFPILNLKRFRMEWPNDR